jgi:hypothetical protein
VPPKNPVLKGFSAPAFVAFCDLQQDHCDYERLAIPLKELGAVS